MTHMEHELYTAAQLGNIGPVSEYEGRLDQLLTPTGNTILHIVISCATPSGQYVKIPGRFGFYKMVPAPILEFINQVLDKCPCILFQANAKVKTLIQEDPEELSYCPNKSYETPLYIAARNGYRHLVASILDQCISADHRGPNGRTALHAAIMAKDEATVKILVEKRKKLTKVGDENGQIPLHYAAHFGSDRIVRFLLGCDRATAYMVDKDGMTALLMAARQGYRKIMAEIIDYSPDCCEITDKRGWSFVHFAMVALPQASITEMMPQFRNRIDDEDIYGNTPKQVLLTARPYANNVCDQVSQEELDSEKKEQIFKVLDEIGSEEVGGLPVRHLHTYRPNQNNDKPEARLMVAGLIATIAFTAAFAVPGGYRSEPGKDEGTAVLSHRPSIKLYEISLAIALVFALLEVARHFYLSRAAMVGYPTANKLHGYSFRLIPIAIGALVVAFAAGIYTVLKPALAVAIATCLIALSFFVFAI
ncbi:hypothetical protein COLO4_17870 [Corchorus olitorius]|uniref:PGG domain-containing protein n=1 Tax=Corchorus olitorius TaxID=93759 RepID=A0A1R3JBA1_9ROSI|nr:hypothetical protein COLO4_17870 [Corchorus olitorius]